MGVAVVLVVAAVIGVAAFGIYKYRGAEKPDVVELDQLQSDTVVASGPSSYGSNYECVSQHNIL